LLKIFLQYATISLAALLEIMLGGNFKEEYIAGIKSAIERYTAEYSLIFDGFIIFSAITIYMPTVIWMGYVLQEQKPSERAETSVISGLLKSNKMEVYRKVVKEI
jgi:hypothetical protein